MENLSSKSLNVSKLVDMANHKTNHNCRLYVGNIDFKMTKDEIEEFFSKAGQVMDIYFPKREGDTRPHKGYIFVQMGNVEQTIKAIRMFHQVRDYYDRELIVRLADFRKGNIQ